MTFSQSDFVYSFSPTNWISISDCSMSHPVDIENVVASLRVIRKDILHSSTSNSNLSQSSMEWIRRYDPNTDQYSYFHSTNNSLYSSNPWLSSSSSSSSSTTTTTTTTTTAATETIFPKTDQWIQIYDEREGKIFLFQPSSGREQWIHPTSEMDEKK